MLSTILNAFQVADIRKKLAASRRAMLLHLPPRLIDPGAGRERRGGRQPPEGFGGAGILSLLNLFSGGGLSRLAIFALGIMPYITSSIILQLLQVVVPSLEKLSKEGEVGQARITQYTRYLTVGLAFAQSIGYVFLFHSCGQACESVDPALRPAAHLPDRHLADRGHGAGDVDRRADHPARHRQRDLADDLRQHRLAPARRGADLVEHADQVFKVMLPFLVLAVRRRRRLRAGGPAAHPGAVRETRDRPAHDRGRPDLPAAAREHGGRHPGDLRRASLMAFPPTLGQIVNTQWSHRRSRLLLAERLALHRRRGDPDHDLHLLLHGGHVQPGRPGGQPEEVRRLHPRGAARAGRRPNSSTGSWRG